MAKPKRRKRSSTQTLLWLLSLFLVASMIISLIVVTIPGAIGSPEPTPTSTPLPPTPTLTQSPAVPETTPVIGPELSTETVTP